METCPANSHCAMNNAKCLTECACDEGYGSGVDEDGSLSCGGKGVRGGEGVFVVKASGMDEDDPALVEVWVLGEPVCVEGYYSGVSALSCRGESLRERVHQ